MQRLHELSQEGRLLARSPCMILQTTVDGAPHLYGFCPEVLWPLHTVRATVAGVGFPSRKSRPLLEGTCHVMHEQVVQLLRK